MAEVRAVIAGRRGHQRTRLAVHLPRRAMTLNAPRDERVDTCADSSLIDTRVPVARTAGECINGFAGRRPIRARARRMSILGRWRSWLTEDDRKVLRERRRATRRPHQPAAPR